MTEEFTRSMLLEPQQQLYDNIIDDWAHALPTVVQAGQRSGKSFMSSALANDRNKRVLGVALTLGRAKALIADPLRDNLRVDMTTGKNLQEAIRADKLQSLYGRTGLFDDQTTIIIDEAFWMPGSEYIFDALRMYSLYVLAIGSKGPERWRDRKRIRRYATWELNPRMSRDHPAIINAYRNDPVKAARDFGNEEVADA